MKKVSLCEGCGAGYDLSLSKCPYCHADRMMSNDHTLDPIVFDTECYRHYWLLKTLNPATGEIWTFEMFEGHPLDVIGIRNLLTTHTVVSFNGIKYDMPMIAYALSGASCSQIKDASDMIITQNMQPWEFYRAFNLTEPTSVDHIDLIEVAPGQGSLKAYGGKMHTRKLQDLPYPPDMVIEWPHRVMLREYCGNDLAVTAEMWNTFQTQIELRIDMSEEYGLDLRSKSDAQIAEAVMKSLLPFKVERPNIPAGTQFCYQAPDWITFKTPQLQDALHAMTTLPFVVTDTGGISPHRDNHFIDWSSDQLRLDTHGQWIKCPKDWMFRPITIAGNNYAMGSGGLHSMESRIVWRGDDAMSLRMPDVEAYYPNLICRTGIYPPQIGPVFLTHYAGWKARRTAFKKAKNKKKANSFKTLNNGSFGKLNSKWSIFYTPAGMIQVTVTGQLALLMLIEALDEVGIPAVSANTDGLVMHAPREMDWLADSIIAWWEGVTEFTMEMSEFSLLAARDVNSYVAIGLDGDVKLKGAFAPPEPGASGWPNPTGQVCVDAVVAFLKDGTPLRDTITACADVRQFVYVRSVTGGASHMPHGTMPRKTTLTAMRAVVGDITDKVALVAAYTAACDARASTGEYLGKVVRWVFVRNSSACITYKSSGNLVPRTIGCRPLMELPDALPDDIDYEWYIAEAESLLSDIGVTR